MRRRNLLKGAGASAIGGGMLTAMSSSVSASSTQTNIYLYVGGGLDLDKIYDGWGALLDNFELLDHEVNVQFEEYVDGDDLDESAGNNLEDLWEDYLERTDQDRTGEGEISYLLADVRGDTVWSDYQVDGVGGATKGQGRWAEGEFAQPKNYWTGRTDSTGFKRSTVHEFAHTAMHPDYSHHDMGDWYPDGQPYQSTPMGYKEQCSSRYHNEDPPNNGTTWGTDTISALNAYMSDGSKAEGIPDCKQ